MKQLKFRPKLILDILEERKTLTWRLFDDKDLRVGDVIELVNADDLTVTGKVRITDVRLKTLGTVSEEDYEGHTRYKDEQDLLTRFRKYYGETVTMETPVKIIAFEPVR